MDERFELLKFDLDAAQRIQERVQYYFVTLTFTLLALSVQTGTFLGSNVSVLSEVGGWCFLFVSAVVGLSRIKNVPGFHKKSAAQYSLCKGIERVKELTSDGATTIHLRSEKKDVVADEYINNLQNDIDKLDEEKRKFNVKQSILMTVHRVTLLTGIILILFARSVDAVYKALT